MFPDEAQYIDNPQTAAYSVAVMIAVMAVLLWGMKKSGFKAMVAVGG